MIVCAAIKTADGKVWALPRPARHFDILRVIAFETDAPVRGEEQGFLLCDMCRHDAPALSCPIVDNAPHGLFARRPSAEYHGRLCGQLTRPPIGGVLTSEDLW